MTDRYQSAKEHYATIGVDTDRALHMLQNIPISMHCWQGDDVSGFDGAGALSGGIQVTGNHPGKARTPQELMSDIDVAFSMIPGWHNLNLHASYAIFKDGQAVDRDRLRPEHFQDWVAFAKERGIGLDFNPTFFSHPLAAQATLSSSDENIRKFWIAHGQACIRISEYFATELGKPCVMNIWIPDGYKDIPADRTGPRARFKDSLDQILSIPYDKSKVYVCLESKVFGIGKESYTVGSSEFCLEYAAKNGIISLMDNGHYHPTEVVSDKIPALLAFFPEIALHITRPVRWDSDHVVLFNDEIKDIAAEIVRCNALDKVMIGLDYFDASINRLSAWVTGQRSMQKALLQALLTPHEKLAKLQDEGNFTLLMAEQERMKDLPFAAVWEEYLQRQGKEREYYPQIRKYEIEELSGR